jgi:hypothetical protein
MQGFKWPIPTRLRNKRKGGNALIQNELSRDIKLAVFLNWGVPVRFRFKAPRISVQSVPFTLMQHQTHFGDGWHTRSTRTLFFALIANTKKFGIEFEALLNTTMKIASQAENAGVAQLVERNLAKVEVESSRLFSRSTFKKGSRSASLFFVRLKVSGLAFFSPEAVSRRLSEPGASCENIHAATELTESSLHFCSRCCSCPWPNMAEPSPETSMSSYNAPFEIHVHGDVVLRPDVTFDQLQDALKPLWKYAGARSLADGAASAYEDEPGIEFDAKEHVLHICWTVNGDEDFRQNLDEMCMSLNELSGQGAAIEVSFYDADFDDDEEPEDSEARDDFVMLFVGPTPAAIMQVQRDLLVEDVVNMMERHFDGAELGGVVAEIDKLFGERFEALVNSLEIGKPPRGTGGSGPAGGHGGGRRPRHLH